MIEFELEVGGGGDLSDVLCPDFQAVPCPLSPEDCQWPTEFPELLDMRLLFNDDDLNCDDKDSKEGRGHPAVESDQMSPGRVLVSPPSGRAASALVGFKVAFNIDKS